MPLTFKICEKVNITPHICNGCIEVEQGGLRGGAFISSSYIPRTPDGLISKDVENFSWWETGINEEKIYIVPRTRGTFDGGSPKTSPGYGDLNEIITGKTFTAVMSDPDHTDNEEFYAAIADAPGGYHFAWRTGNELRISDTGVNIDPADAVEEDVNSQVVWTVTITWDQSRKTVQIFELNKEVFQCFDTTGDAFSTSPSGFTTFANSGGTQSLTVTSTISELPAGWTIHGTFPPWASVSKSGNQLNVVLISTDSDVSRSFDIVLVQDLSGRTITRRVTQAASAYVLSFGVSQNFPSGGGSQQIPVTSTLNGMIIGWTFDALNSSPYVKCTAGEGTSSPTFTVTANSGSQRNIIITIKQSVGTMTATKTIIQEAIEDMLGNCYAGGMVADVLITTETEVHNLINTLGGTQSGGGIQPIATNVQKGQQASFRAGYPIMRIYMVVPTVLGKPSSFWDLDINAELMPRVDDDTNQHVEIKVDGVMCTVYWIRNLVPAAGFKNIRITF